MRFVHNWLLSSSPRSLARQRIESFLTALSSLVDSEMCETAVSQKIDFLARIESVLVGTVKISECSFHPSPPPPPPHLHLICPSGTSVITQCCIHELYIRGISHQPAVDLAKSFERRKCNHREAIPGNECIASLVGTQPTSLLLSHVC